MGLTQAQAARRLGISTAAVAKRVAKGQLRRLADGTLSPASVESARSDIDPQRIARAKRGVATPLGDEGDAPTAPEAPAPAKTTDRSPPPQPQPPASRAPTPHERKALADAEKTEMMVAKLRGQVIDLAEATRAFRDFGRRVHDAVLGIADDAQRSLEGRVLCKCGEPVDSKHLALEIERHLRGVLEVLAKDPLGGKGS